MSDCVHGCTFVRMFVCVCNMRACCMRMRFKIFLLTGTALTVHTSNNS